MITKTKYNERYEKFENIAAFRRTAKTLKGSRDFGAQLFTALLYALGADTRLLFSLQPLGFNFGKQEDAHRLVKNDKPEISKKRKRQKEDSDDDLGLPKITRGIPFLNN